mmetsp:Transcript_6213/g.5336  ORF Transcript_6213/g.5336 Transcript_6213/m.5336 type:complete len:118 (+) Transcript_6213:564-917(+)
MDIQTNPLLSQEQRRTRVEAEVTKFLIDHRKEGLSKVTNVMAGLRDLGVEFNEEVNMQGDKLVIASGDLENANVNTQKATEEIKKFSDRLKGKGIKMIFCLGILVLILIFLIYMIFK